MLRLFTWDMAGNFTGAMPYGQAPLGLGGCARHGCNLMGESP